MTATATATPAAAAMRVRSVTSASLLPEDVAHAADGVDGRVRTGLLQLAAQVADIDAQRVRGRTEVVAPHALVDQRVREHAAGVAHEQLEQEVLRACQLDDALADCDAVAVRLEAQVGEHDRAF